MEAGMRGAGTRWAIAALLACLLLGPTTAARAAGTAPADPYVALGDSYTVGWENNSTPTKGFVGRLFPSFKRALGADGITNTGVPGESTDTMLKPNGQLTTALADINGPTDTRALTLEIGGYEALFGTCPGHWDDPSACDFRANYALVLSQLQAALAKDPGSETLLTTAYPNPSAGTGTPTEGARDRALLGNNLKVGCSDTGANMGLNDAIFQLAGAVGVPVANPYPVFEQHGQSYFSPNDPLHVHPNDAGYAAIADAFGHPTTPCGSTPDRNPPDTTIKRGPTSGRTHDRTPTFKLASSEAHSTFKCALDGAKLRKCAAGYTTPKLDIGRHLLEVEAKDSAGNVDPAPATASFKVVG
jgi:lysophospholipase L1-like esterase